MNKKKLKVLVLSDHALSTSGVGVQTRHLISGLLKKNLLLSLSMVLGTLI